MKRKRWALPLLLVTALFAALGVIRSGAQDKPPSRPEATLDTRDLVQRIEVVKQQSAAEAAKKTETSTPAPAETAAEGPALLEKTRNAIRPWFNPNLGPDADKAMKDIAELYAAFRESEKKIIALRDRLYTPALEEYNRAGTDAQRAAAQARLEKAQAEFDKVSPEVETRRTAFATALDLAGKAGILSSQGKQVVENFGDSIPRKPKAFSGS
ncbi:MAG: hypothetical protein KA419_19345 [Acidobacteria bacterium]|nr:hypothetical protein [Acidobacteriota bacterium]